MIRASSEGRSRNSYWPMPFRRSCRITVTNEGSRRVANLYYHVDWKKVPLAPAGHGLLPRALPPGRSELGRAAVRGPRRSRPRALRRNRSLDRPGGSGLVRRGRRFLLRRRRDEALHRGDRHGGLLQRRVGPARRHRSLRGGIRRRRDRPRLADDRLPVAPRGPDPVPQVAAFRLRAQGLDLPPRRLGQVGASGERTDLISSVALLVPGRHRDGPARGSLRRRAAAAGERAPDRGRDRVRGSEGHEGQGLASRKTSSGRRTSCSSRARARARASTCPSTFRRTAATSSTRRSRRASTTASTRCFSTESPSLRRSSSTSRARTCCPTGQVEGYAPETYVGVDLPRRLARAREGPARRDVRLHGQGGGVARVQARRRQPDPREGRRGGVVGHGEPGARRGRAAAGSGERAEAGIAGADACGEGGRRRPAGGEPGACGVGRPGADDGARRRGPDRARTRRARVARSGNGVAARARPAHRRG